MSGDAHAEPRAEAVLVPTELSGFVPSRDEWQHAFDSRLRDVLVAKQSLPTLAQGAEAAPCRDAACARARAGGAALALGARVIEDERTPPGYNLHLWLYRSVDQTFWQFERACPGCTEALGADALGTLADRALSTLPAPQLATPPKPQSPIQSTNAWPAPPAKTARSVVALRGSAITAGLLGLGAIAFGIFELSIDHTRHCPPADPNCAARIDTSYGQVFGFVTGGALLSASVPLAVFGWRQAPHLTPEVTSKSAALAFGWNL